MRSKHLGWVLVFVLTAVLSSLAVEKEKPAIDWQKGPVKADLGGMAEIQIPKGFLFTDKKGAQKLLELTQNIPDGNEVGALIPDNEKSEKVWFVIFEFHETGFVKDDDKSSIDANALLKSIQDATEESNEERKDKGWPAFHVAGWEQRPFYDQSTHNLTWAIRGHGDQGDDSVNHSIRILGRRGTMNVDLVLDPQQYATVVPEFNDLMASFQFRQGSRYADFVKGDKVAAYGLTALIAGGAGAVAVKTGLLLKLWKFILVAVLALKKALIVVFAALAAAIKKIWAKIRGKRDASGELEPTPPQPLQTEGGDVQETTVNSGPTE
jgi:uncharacterized membrane-anchored protein